MAVGRASGMPRLVQRSLRPTISISRRHSHHRIRIALAVIVARPAPDQPVVRFGIEEPPEAPFSPAPIAPFPAVVRNRERASAQRLQLGRIPLYQIHQSNPVVPDSVIMPGMRDLLDSGRIGAVGVSNYSLERWRKADAALGRPVISNQVEFSLAHPRALDDLVPFAERENRIVIAYSPLAQGLLGGRYGPDNRPGGVRALNSLFGSENLRRVEPLLQTLRDVASQTGTKPAQVALAWLISLPNVVAIPGASSVEQLEFNVAAADIELNPRSRDTLTAAARAFRRVSAGRFLLDKVREKLGRG